MPDREDAPVLDPADERRLWDDLLTAVSDLVVNLLAPGPATGNAGAAAFRRALAAAFDRMEELQVVARRSLPYPDELADVRGLATWSPPALARRCCCSPTGAGTPA